MTKEDQQQQINGKISEDNKEPTKEELKTAEKVGKLVKASFVKQNAGLKSAVELGIALVSARIQLKSRFKKVIIDAKIINDKTSTRHQKLVLDPSTPLKRIMSDTDLASLKIYEKFKDIKSLSFNKLKSPSFQKIINIKEAGLNKKYEGVFEKSFEGDDTLYDQYLKDIDDKKDEKSKKSKKEKEKTISLIKSKLSVVRFTDTEIDRLVNKKPVELLEEIISLKKQLLQKELDDLENKLEVNDPDIDVSDTSNLYIPESKEKEGHSMTN